MADPDLRIVKSEPLPELTLADEKAAPEGAVSRFASGAWKNLNPMGLVSAATHPVDTVTNLLAAHKAQYDKAQQAYAEGRYSEAAGHLGAAALPVIGPAAAEAGEKIGAGDVAGGLGEGAGLIGSVFAPRAAQAAKAPVGAAIRTASKLVSPEIAARLVKHGATAAGATVGGPAGAIVGSEIGADLAARLKARLTPTPPRPSGPGPRLVKSGGPALSDQLHGILEEIHQEPTGGSTAPTEAGSTPGGAQAATSSMRMLAEKPELAKRFSRTISQDEASPIYRATDFTKPTVKKVPVHKIVATQEGFQDPIIEQYQLHPGSERPSGTQLPNGEVMLNDGHHRSLAQMANGAQEIEIDVHPMDAALAAKPQPRAMWLTDRGQQVTAPQARMMERMGRSTPYRSEGGPPAPIPLSEAMSAVQQAAKSAGVKLTAAETPELVKVVRQGRPAAHAIDALAIHKALKDLPVMADMPSDADVASVVREKNMGKGDVRARAVREARESGAGKTQKQLNEEALARRRREYSERQTRDTAAESGNPFR